MLRRGVPLTILLALTAFAVAAISIALCPGRPALWSAAIALAILGGTIPMISAINIRIIPVFSRRNWASAHLLSLQLGLSIAGGWLVWIGRGWGIDPLEAAGHLAALAGAVVLAINVRLLFRSAPAPAMLPRPTQTQQAMDRIGILFSRLSMLFLLVGLAIGVWMTITETRSGRVDLAWAHALLVGYVLSSIAGVCYHVLERWTGRVWTERSIRVARIHLIATVVAVPLMILALARDISWLFAIAGPLEATALLLFVGVITPAVRQMPALSRWAMIMAGSFLAIGVFLGAWFAGHPELGPQFRMTHATLNLFGFVLLMISGVAYYLLPRMFGQPLRFPALAVIQVSTSASGVVLLASAWAVRFRWQGPAWMIEAGGCVVAVGVVLLAMNLGLTMRRATALPGTTARLPMIPRPTPNVAGTTQTT